MVVGCTLVDASSWSAGDLMVNQCGGDYSASFTFVGDLVLVVGCFGGSYGPGSAG